MVHVIASRAGLGGEVEHRRGVRIGQDAERGVLVLEACSSVARWDSDRSAVKGP